MPSREAGPLPSKSAAVLPDYSEREEPEEMQAEPSGVGPATTPAMASQTTVPRAPPRSRPNPKNRVPPAAGCVGRDMEQSKLLYALLEEGAPDGAPAIAQPAAIYGIAGSGKTSLMLSVLNDPRIKERFANNIFYIDCRAATDAVRLAAVLFDALSRDPRSAFRNATIDSAGFASQATLARLDDQFDLLEGDEPSLVALDNLEAAFENHPWAIEDILVRLLERANVFIAMRDCVLPSVGRKWVSIRLGKLSGEAGRDAFSLHSADFAESHDVTEIDGLVELVGGHALSLGLLGRLAAGSGGDIAELEALWKRELTRPTTPRDTPRTHLPSCLAISFQSPSIKPLHIQLLLAASQLPISVSLSGGASSFFLAGLPRTLADKICAAHDASDDAPDVWAQLRRNGILSISSEHPHKLNLVAPIRTYLAHRATKELDPKTKEALEAWTSELNTRVADLPEPVEPSKEEKDGEDPPQIRMVMGLSGTFETLLPALHARMALQRFCGNDKDANEIEAFSCVLEADCTDSADAALVLRRKSVRLFRLCKMELDAVLEDAKVEDLMADQAENVGNWPEAIKHRELAVTLWTRTGREKMATMTEAQVCEARARMAVDANDLSEAIEYRTQASALWLEGGNEPRSQINHAQKCELLACVAANNGDQEEAARKREEGSDIWFAVGKESWGVVEKAKALKIRGQMAFERNQLEEALEIFEEAVEKFRVSDDDRETAWAEAAVASIKSRLAGAAGELAMTVDLLEEADAAWARYDPSGKTTAALGGFGSDLYRALIAIEADNLTEETFESAQKAVEYFPAGDTDNRACNQCVADGVRLELNGDAEGAAAKYEEAAAQEAESTPPYKEDIFVTVLRKRIAKLTGVEYVEPAGAESQDVAEADSEAASAAVEQDAPAPEAVKEESEEAELPAVETVKLEDDEPEAKQEEE